MYLKELEQVTALLAYTDVEHSPVRRFLHKSRKVALAEQVNSAILLRSGRPSQPLVEVAVRQTTLLWIRWWARRYRCRGDMRCGVGRGGWFRGGGEEGEKVCRRGSLGVSCRRGEMLFLR